MWAITSYFNPMRFRRKRRNYQLFREALNVPLVTVELAYGADFELSQGDADILIQLRGRDVLWQKERLLNLALAALPPDCRDVAWLDCDILFEAKDWAERSSRLLDERVLLQPFSHLHHMPEDWSPGMPRPARTKVQHPPAFLIASGMQAPTIFGDPRTRIAHYKPGVAWVARRAFLERHSFYDACIVGGGDAAMVRAAFGFIEEAMQRQGMGNRKREHFLAWALPFHDEVRANVGYIEGNVLHLWHGSLDDRSYDQRQEGLKPFDFDPYNDIAADGNGAWRWGSDKRDMHDYVRDYFASRREDGGRVSGDRRTGAPWVSTEMDANQPDIPAPRVATFR